MFLSFSQLKWGILQDHPQFVFVTSRFLDILLEADSFFHVVHYSVVRAVLGHPHFTFLLEERFYTSV